jgi:hypothetical protein
MGQKFIKLIKKIVLAGFILYGYNLMVAPLDLIIPINIFTLGMITVFGISAVPFLALVLIIVFN